MKSINLMLCIGSQYFRKNPVSESLIPFLPCGSAAIAWHWQGETYPSIGQSRLFVI
ncbi:MAG TPA: hypothetical protein VF043_06880 [Ktedonobacteraceae bacterium]